METKPVLFSIITITRNNRLGLEKTAQSIALQSAKNFEWIIIDGDSTDGTSADFKNYPAHIISEPDNGIYDAMNKGIDCAKGDYIIFMNAGDQFSDPDVLQMLGDFTVNPPDFMYGDSLEGPHYKSARPYHKINQGMFTHHQSMIYNSKTLGDLRYNLDYKIAADYDLTLRFLQRSKRILYIPAALCIFEQGGISQKQAKLGRNEQFLSRKNNKIGTTLSNHSIRAGQIMFWTLRNKFPSLYWLIRKCV
jgi:putative colanic acid biosynthesis glycosyltransferase